MDYDKALAGLSKSIRPAGINYFWLGAAYAVRGDKETALATLQKVFDAGFHDFARSIPVLTSRPCARTGASGS